MSKETQYGVSTWLATRKMLSTCFGVGVVGVIAAWFFYNNVVVVKVAPSNPRWFLSTVMILSLILSLIGITNTLPLAPEWEQPLRQRTCVAHLAAWIAMSLSVSLGGWVATLRIFQLIDDLQGSLVFVSFAMFTLGVCTCTVLLLGRMGGVVAGIGLVLGVIVTEQMTNTRFLLADTRSDPQWIPAILVYCAGAFLSYRTAGHPRKRAKDQ